MGHEYADFTIYVVVCFLLLFLQQSLHCNAQQPSDLLEQRSAEYASRRFPGCVAGERLHGGVNPESNSLDSRRIVSIGDVHGSLIGLHELLWTAGITERNSCQWHPDTASNGGVVLVQTGDIVDRGPNASEAWLCLKNLQSKAHEHNSQVIRLVGNHELWWLSGQISYRNKKTDTKEKVEALINLMKEEIISGAVKGAHAMDTAEGLPLFFVHAGIRPQMMDHLRKSIPALVKGGAKDESHVVAEYINTKLLEDVKRCTSAGARCPLDDLVYSAGPERGGSAVGGPYWTDFSVLEKAHAAEAAKEDPSFLPFVQVVGHTVEVNAVRSTRGLGAVCTDAGMMYGGRAFLTIEDSRFVSYSKEEKKRSTVTVSTIQKPKWNRRDLTELECT